MDAEVFHARVYDLVRDIPSGKVTTYGQIAKLAGYPRHARMVGAALKYLQDTTVPWQRVVGSGGVISERGDGGEGAAHQANLLRSEGVEVVPAQSDRGRWRVHSFAAYAWGT
ncbi:Alkyltransferase-like protein 1 [Malassezia brasiliensis]|uniref:Alkyltransferase-like protein 1 n=1 Tax=Malassezia brasiliensis TaxID=1821822 RepID=A0AAF0DPI4_9BASI|nr:Alkyltransferase-like protein 1 [Malassezia brasiliensis]